MPALSVVLPVYNGERTLTDCLDALLAQLPEDSEVVVVDDASTDGTPELLARYPVRALRNAENRGTSASRNRGWRATSAPLIAFVDADVVLRPGALAALLDALTEDPALLGANGLLALDLSTPGLVSGFVNTSIHYQHLRHGDRISTSFTSLCVFRRSALEQMGGWDDRWFSRYADDVATRFTLPEGSLGLARGALGDHLKRVRARGLLKHRFNIGYFWLLSTSANWSAVRGGPASAVLALRFPLNTIGGGLVLIAAPLALVSRAGAGLALGAATATFFVANARFVAFTLKHRGPAEAAAALPLSALEGIGCAAGVAWAIMGVPGRLRARSRSGGTHEHA